MYTKLQLGTDIGVRKKVKVKTFPKLFRRRKEMCREAECESILRLLFRSVEGRRQRIKNLVKKNCLFVGIRADIVFPNDNDVSHTRKKE